MKNHEKNLNLKKNIFTLRFKLNFHFEASRKKTKYLNYHKYNSPVLQVMEYSHSSERNTPLHLFSGYNHIEK